ncbi:hypothetical protein BLNAU_22075 [Blattamonas nauphoetae]|uniref:Uncharacterized protein n=1 Tax=Blattamonas nauphoetae TaxID=2049346 RepID=A0ABQ9WV46_9EUKA|nr:hypothetical protein BLNAU_22075 [Blattamonas nauphoetae]
MNEEVRILSFDVGAERDDCTPLQPAASATRLALSPQSPLLVAAAQRTASHTYSKTQLAPSLPPASQHALLLPLVLPPLNCEDTPEHRAGTLWREGRFIVSHTSFFFPFFPVLVSSAPVTLALSWRKGSDPCWSVKRRCYPYIPQSFVCLFTLPCHRNTILKRWWMIVSTGSVQRQSRSYESATHEVGRLFRNEASVNTTIKNQMIDGSSSQLFESAALFAIGGGSLTLSQCSLKPETTLGTPLILRSGNTQKLTDMRIISIIFEHTTLILKSVHTVSIKYIELVKSQSDVFFPAIDTDDLIEESNNTANTGDMCKW